MKSNKTKSAMTALVVAAMLCSAAMPIRAAEAQWVNNNGTWSYVKEDGSIAKGWIKDNNCWYAFDDNGAMRTAGSLPMNIGISWVNPVSCRQMLG